MVDSPRLVCVGNLVPVKNHERLLAAFARVHPRTGGSLAIVGTGPLEDDLRRRSADLGLDAAVTFAGEIEPHLVPRWLRAADAACLVSEREGFGLAALEALACGRPVGPADSRVGRGEPGRRRRHRRAVRPARRRVDRGGAGRRARLRPGAAAEAAAAPYALGREARRVAAILQARGGRTLGQTASRSKLRA